MNNHLSDEDLILHFYGEGRDSEGRVDEHLRVCRTCQSAWSDLRATLQLVDTATVPEPEPGFEDAMWQRVKPQLPSKTELSRRSWPTNPLLALAAAAVIVLLAGYAWIASRHAVTPSSQPARVEVPALVPEKGPDKGEMRERALLTALNEHFDHTELLLVELMNSPDSPSLDVDFERQTADDLVASGRLYRVAAEQNGDVRLTELLDDLESVLVEVARGPERLNRKAVASLRARIESGNLLFKVRAVSNQIQERQKKFSTE